MEPLRIGDRLELFVNDFLIENMNGVSLKLHEPCRANIVLRFDAPWEGAFCGYGSILSDNGVYRLYYRGWPSRKGGQVTCYAESHDGIVFEKPNLGLHEIEGTYDNNVILADWAYPVTHNFSPFIDKRPGVPLIEKYKAVGGLPVGGGLWAYASENGITWSRLYDEPIIRYGSFDSQNVAFWSESENCYVCYRRVWIEVEDGENPEDHYFVRTIGRTTSEDFRSWSPTERMEFGEAPLENLYTNQTQPYYRAPHICLAFPMRFVPWCTIMTNAQARKLGIVKGYRKGCADVGFMTSRGGTHYDRTFMESFIRPGLDLGNWASRAGQMVYGMVQTGPTELSLYRQAHYAQPASRIDRYTLRVDGFASVNAPYTGGEFVTKPLIFDGTRLTINYSTSVVGNVRVEIQNVSGTAFSGYSLNESVAVVGDEIERTIKWRTVTNVSKLAGKPIRLRFVMRDADLYSLRFKDNKRK